MRIVFLGTPEFALPTLRALAASPHEVLAAVCQPDRPRGRGHHLVPCPVKQEAERLGVPVLTPARIRDKEAVSALSALSPDLFVTCAYGQLLSQAVLDIPRLGTFNVHPSLLPRHRGSAPVNWTLMAGETRTGVTIMKTDIGMDSGDILLQEETDILPEENAEDLEARLSAVGAELLMRALSRLMDGTLTATPQDPALVTVEPRLTREMGEMDWRLSSRELAGRVRGLAPWPGTFTRLSGTVIKVLRARETDGEGAPGEILECRGHLVAACGEGALEILQLQLPGKPPVAADAYLRGHALEKGTRFGGQA